jgi:hypothetical protein
MRKYHYTDIDPTSTTSAKVYSGWNVPSAIFGDNNGKYPYRVRPRYNSEYVWNIYVPAAARALDYHTVQTWFSLP